MRAYYPREYIYGRNPKISSRIPTVAKRMGHPTRSLRLPDLPEYRLGADGDLNGFDATDIEFLNFVQTPRATHR